MDWILAATTLLVNGSLGWFKGDYRAWLAHALNATAWIFYSIYGIHQWGMVGLSVVTLVVDLVSACRSASTTWTIRSVDPAEAE